MKLIFLSVYREKNVSSYNPDNQKRVILSILLQKPTSLYIVLSSYNLVIVYTSELHHWDLIAMQKICSETYAQTSAERGREMRGVILNHCYTDCKITKI